VLVRARPEPRPTIDESLQGALDRSTKRAFCKNMRARIAQVTLVLLAAAGPLFAQQAATNGVASVSSSVTLHQAPAIKPPETTPMLHRLSEPKDTNSMDFQVSKTTQVHLTGPLIQPLKAKSASGFAGRVAHWFNPFSTAQPNVPPAPSGPINTRAWSTIVGWNPGRSAFPDGAWHEPPHLDLISITTEKQP
jgi:hypothetical protein